ncbi:sugar-binding transcriptional regulator [Ornithinimicrobium avium]|uniref:Transcriptional regulator n=1 Tax=Ornithinimicrobium avium TaxID=2283195 RepID=A0A345NIT4_9MICO|nr:sugar-binding domain-containing protein [Ornithinimicrobium avium]AXH94942.1 transcriptional regulator [Ornithinimicrobium avium]
MAAEEGSRAGEDDLVLAATVTRRHLVAGESKVDIAADLGLSRFKVARLIDQAHAAGLVRIEVEDPRGSSERLAQQLQERLGLRHAAVVDSTGRSPTPGAVGEAAARLLCGLLDPDDVLGLPWSRGVHQMVNALQSLGMRPPPVPVVQLSGALATGSEDSSTVDVVRRAARVLQGGRTVFFAPLVMPDADAAATLRREPSVTAALAAADTVTVAVVGVGAWSAGSSTVFDAVDATTRREVSRAGGTGEIAGRTFAAAGDLVVSPLDERLVSLSGDQLRGIDEVVAIAHGPDKVEVLRAAVAGGLVTSLVTTSATAELLLG